MIFYYNIICNNMKELQNSSKIRLPIELIDQIISYTDNIELIYEFGSKYMGFSC